VTGIRRALYQCHGNHWDPIGAQAFRQAHHWNDAGGWLRPGQKMAMNGAGQDEAVLTRPHRQRVI
jgi:hypothetical protein